MRCVDLPALLNLAPRSEPLLGHGGGLHEALCGAMTTELAKVHRSQSTVGRWEVGPLSDRLQQRLNRFIGPTGRRERRAAQEVHLWIHESDHDRPLRRLGGRE